MSTDNILGSDPHPLAPVISRGVARDTHEVQFYGDDGFLVHELTRLVGVALGRGESAIIIATEHHRNALTHRLQDCGVDVSGAIAQGRFIALDASDALSKIMIDHRPDADRFASFMSDTVRSARMSAHSGRGRVTVFGEMVALLFAAGEIEGAIQLERLWNKLAQIQSFSLRCAYPISVFREEHHAEQLSAICAEHAQVIPEESYSRLSTNDERLRSVATLQQKARALQSVAEDRERLATALAAEVRDLRRLHEISTRVSRLDLQQVMQEVVSAVAELHHTDMGLLWLCRPDRNELEVGASIGFSKEFLDSVQTVRAGSGACGLCMERHERVIVEDLETDPIFAEYKHAAQVGGFRGVHSTPLMDHSGVLVGVLSVHFRTPFRPSEREIQLTDLFAQLAVNAIDNACLYREAQEEIARRKQAEAALMQRIAELQRAHSALMEAEKLAATGRLAATIAHEINNPLEAIINLFYLMKSQESLTPEARAYADLCEQELERVAHIVRQTLGFYRPSTKPALVSISQLVRDALALNAKRLQSSGIEIHEDLESDRRLVVHDGELRQVILNVIGNAIQAMTSGDKLYLRVRPGAHWKNHSVQGVRITIADTGRGIAPANQSRIFDPFFSTKSDKGTGLGLWVTKGIVQKHQGSIRFRSRVGPRSGTCFSIFLPEQPARSAEETTPPGIAEPESSHRQAPTTI